MNRLGWTAIPIYTHAQARTHTHTRTWADRQTNRQTSRQKFRKSLTRQHSPGQIIIIIIIIILTGLRGKTQTGNNNNNNDSSHITHCMRSTHLLTISSQAALSEADCTASRSDRLMHCKSFLTTSIHLRRGRPRGRRMSVVLIDIRRAWKEDDSSPSLTTWPNHSSIRCLQTWDSGVCSVLAYSAVFEIRCGYAIPMMVRSFSRCHTLTTSVNVCDKVQSAQLYSKTGNIRQENIHSLEFRLWRFHGMLANARFAADTLAAMSSAVPSILPSSFTDFQESSSLVTVKY